MSRFRPERRNIYRLDHSGLFLLFSKATSLFIRSPYREGTVPHCNTKLVVLPHQLLNIVEHGYVDDLSGQKFDQRISAWPPSPHAERVPIAIGRGRRNSKIASSSRRDWCHILMRGYLYFDMNCGIIAERNHTDDLLVQAMTKDLQPGLPRRLRRGNEGEVNISGVVSLFG